MFRQKKKVKVYAKLYSNLRLNTIKFDITMYTYLKNNNTYNRPDHFKCNDVVNPGIITEVHPMLICNKVYYMEAEGY
eukprot:14269599-Ditylum_brightwellii.AAC.1